MILEEACSEKDIGMISAEYITLRKYYSLRAQVENAADMRQLLQIVHIHIKRFMGFDNVNIVPGF